MENCIITWLKEIHIYIDIKKAKEQALLIIKMGKDVAKRAAEEEDFLRVLLENLSLMDRETSPTTSSKTRPLISTSTSTSYKVVEDSPHVSTTMPDKKVKMNAHKFDILKSLVRRASSSQSQSHAEQSSPVSDPDKVYGLDRVVGRKELITVQALSVQPSRSIPTMHSFSVQSASTAITSAQETARVPLSGEIWLEAERGNLVLQNVDAIVNSTSSNLRMDGAVSRAISAQAGAAYIQECREMQMKNGVCHTGAGNLAARYVIHVQTPNDLLECGAVMKKALLEADELGLKTIALPLIGAGGQGLPVEGVAKEMYWKAKELAQLNLLRRVRLIKFVILEQSQLYILLRLLKMMDSSYAKTELQTPPISAQACASPVDQSLPPKWVPMRQDKVSKKVILAKDDPDYFLIEKEVEMWKQQRTSRLASIIASGAYGGPIQLSSSVALDQFSSQNSRGISSLYESCPVKTLHKVYRVQNFNFYQQFLNEKERLKKKYKNDQKIVSNMEQFLFHGTMKSSVPKINEKGFDRSYCGKNATSYGQGVYFAKKLDYAAKDTYSVPTSSGKKYIYMARVLIGDICKGDSQMKHLPENPVNHLEFDTAVDNIQDPKMFVVFRDTQAYPQFLMVLK